VPAVERESRSRVVIERRALESMLVVTGGAILLEGAAVRIAMTGGARLQRQAHRGGRADVAARARDGLMTTGERRSGAGVIEVRHFPRCGRVTGATVAPDTRFVRRAMAIGAGTIRDARITSSCMAFRARNPAMCTFERKPGLCMIEPGLRERHSRVVAPLTVRAEPAAVRVLVTRGAVARQRQIRTRLVAASARDRVTAFEWKSGFSAMVECFRIEWTELRIASGMLDVTGYAVTRRISVDAFFLRDSLCNRSMAFQTPLGGNAAALFMAAAAVRCSFQFLVCPGQRARRDQSTELRRCDDRCKEECKDCEESRGIHIYPPNGT
jgi:hypothetical protein